MISAKAILVLVFFVAGAIFGQVVFRLAAARARRLERERVLAILRAEFNYWSDAPEEEAEGEDMPAIRIGATGAVSNTMAAVLGHPAPWHPGGKPQPESEGVR